MKYENTRIVTFKEDYYIKSKDGGREILHAKGSRHAMHKGIVKVLQDNGAKISVEQLDFKKVEAQKKDAFSKRREVQIK